MRKLVPMTVVLLAGLAVLPPALAQGKRYDPGQRTRVGPLDSCLKDEVMNGAFCVKKCAPGFRLELAARSGTCVAQSADARIPPPKTPEYAPPPKGYEPGAKGS